MSKLSIVIKELAYFTILQKITLKNSSINSKSFGSDSQPDSQSPYMSNSTEWIRMDLYSPCIHLNKDSSLGAMEIPLGE